MVTRDERPDGMIPAPTVREAMTLGAFALANLVAGKAGLNRQVLWVRIMETPETAHKLRPGDLLLTTAFPIKDDREAQLQLISLVAEAGGAGVVVKPERYLKELPVEMAQEADRLSLPLFTLANDVSWMDLMTPLLERIINAEHARLKRSIDIHRRFTELVLDGKGVSEICRTLADLLDSGIAVEDASFHLLAHAGGSSGDAHRKETIARHGTPPRVLFDPQIQQVLREVEANRGPMKVRAFPHLGMSRERIIAPITAANQVLGYISILDQPPDNQELAYMAVEQAALVLALAITKEREVAEVEGRVRGEFLDSLVQDSYGDDAAAQRRARHLGYPLTGSHVVMIVDVDDFRGFMRSRQVTEETIQAIKREFLRRVSVPIRGAFPRALLAAHSDSILALLPLGLDSNGQESRVHSLGLQVRQAVAEWKPGFTVTCVFSGAVEAPSGVASAHREARAVLEAMSRFQRWDQVVFAPQLGLTGLLATISDERLLEFARRHLGPLLEHDRDRSGSLMATLKAYLEAGEQQEAAHRLQIHPNTLRYRLDRISEVAQVELDDPETKLNLSIAIRVQSLLGL